jgi:S-(hydroxymethyl)glutathione dehydrogenase/alcohol dehydrogenase
VGPGVSKVQKGDTVILHWRVGEGKEADPAVYEWKGKKLNAGWVTTFQSHTIVSENRVTKVPSTTDLTVAPLFGCAITTGFGVINNDAQVKIGQSVVVFGCGGVGLNILQGARLCGAYPIIGIDITKEKLALAKKFGATHVIDSLAKDREAQVLTIVGEQGADVVIEATGIIKLMEEAYRLTNKNGKTILVGVPKEGEKMSFYALPIFYKKVLKGSHGGSSDPSIDIPRYMRMLDAGKISFQGLITHTFPLARINDAIALVLTGVSRSMNGIKRYNLVPRMS